MCRPDCARNAVSCAVQQAGRAHGVQRLLYVREQPMAGVISRLTLIESNLTTGGEGLTVLFWSWVVVSAQVCAENQNHPLALPIRFLAISFQWLPERRKPAAVTVASRGWPGSRVAVSTTLKSDKVLAASCRRCGWPDPVALAAGTAVSRPTAVIRPAATAGRRIELNIMVTLLPGSPSTVTRRQRAPAAAGETASSCTGSPAPRSGCPGRK